MKHTAHYGYFAAKLADLDICFGNGGPSVFKPVVVIEKDC